MRGDWLFTLVCGADGCSLLFVAGCTVAMVRDDLKAKTWRYSGGRPDVAGNVFGVILAAILGAGGAAFLGHAAGWW